MHDVFACIWVHLGDENKRTKVCDCASLGTDKQNRNYMMHMGTRDPPYVSSVPTWTRLSVCTPKRDGVDIYL